MQMLHPVLIGAATGWGSRNRGTEKGPLYLKGWGIADKLRQKGIETYWGAMIKPTKPSEYAVIKHRDDTFDEVLLHNQKLAGVIKYQVGLNALPVVIGGDHSCAIGTWSGVIEATNSYGEFGLIWFDAHMDAHTLETADEGKWGGFYHGMPLAHLLGHGQPRLCAVGGDRIKLNPKYVVLVGIRSYEAGEEAFLKSLGVRVITMDEIKKHGLDACMEEAIKIAAAAPKGFGLTLDLDGFDPEDVPAVGTREKDGVRVSEMLPHLKIIGSKEKFRGLEITEFNPERDDNDRTAEVVNELIQTVLTNWSKAQ